MFPTLCTGYMFSRAYLALVTRFSTLCAGFMYSRAYLGLVTRFPTAWAGYMFFHALLLATFFPRLLDTGYMFSHASLALFTYLPMNIENYFFYCNTVSLLKANSHWLYSQIQHKKDFYLMVGTSSGYLANRQSWILLVFSQWPLCRIAIKQNTILSGSR